MANSRNKRRKNYSFTTVEKKNIDWKRGLAEKVRQFVHQYDRLIVFKFVNPRTDLIQELRRKFRRSKFFLGKNRVLQVGLGRSEAEEADTNLHLVSQELLGQRGILFTNESVDYVLNFFNDYKVKTHARPGCRAPSSIELEPGILEGYNYTQDPLMRELGLKTRVTKQGAGTGAPEVLEAFTLCTKGKRVTVNQSKLLKLMGYTKVVNFGARLYCCWERETQEFQKFAMKNGKMIVKGSKKGDGALGDDSDDDDDEEEVTTDEDISEDEMDAEDDAIEFPSHPSMELPLELK